MAEGGPAFGVVVVWVAGGGGDVGDQVLEGAEVGEQFGYAGFAEGVYFMSVGVSNDGARDLDGWRGRFVGVGMEVGVGGWFVVGGNVQVGMLSLGT